MINTEQSFKHKKVMIIDDNEIDRYVCERISKTFYFSEEVVSMESATDALEYLASLNLEVDQLPEVIFLDINMPDMNGFEFLEAYENLPPDIKKSCIIVMLTSSTHFEDQERANKFSYVRGYLNKPLNSEKLTSL